MSGKVTKDETKWVCYTDVTKPVSYWTGHGWSTDLAQAQKYSTQDKNTIERHDAGAWLWVTEIEARTL